MEFHCTVLTGTPHIHSLVVRVVRISRISPSVEWEKREKSTRPHLADNTRYKRTKNFMYRSVSQYSRGVFLFPDCNLLMERIRICIVPRTCKSPELYAANQHITASTKDIQSRTDIFDYTKTPTIQ